MFLSCFWDMYLMFCTIAIFCVFFFFFKGHRKSLSEPAVPYSTSMSLVCIATSLVFEQIKWWWRWWWWWWHETVQSNIACETLSTDYIDVRFIAAHMTYNSWRRLIFCENPHGSQADFGSISCPCAWHNGPGPRFTNSPYIRVVTGAELARSDRKR